MLIVEAIAKIRRLHFTEGKGIKTICRDLKQWKKVMRKVIRTEITEFTYIREGILTEGWDLLAVMHPPYARLCRSGRR